MSVLNRVAAMAMLMGACQLGVSSARAEPVAVAGLPAADIAAYVDGFVQTELKRTGTPGAMVIVVDRAGHRWTKGYGWATPTKTRPMNPETDYFRVASETKVFTALAVMREVERGRINLDADAETYLGGLKLKPAMDRPITVRQLLQHTGGISNFPMAGSAVAWGRPAPSLESVLAKGAPRRLREPGIVAAYTNGAYTLLGRMLETVEGRDYHATIKAEVFDPLDMAGATTDARTLPRDRLVEGVLPGGKRFDIAGTISPPSGDAMATPEQMGNFLEMMLNDGVFRGRRLLGPSTWGAFVGDCFNVNPYGDGFCLGPKRDSYGRLQVLMHGGDYISQMSSWWVVPEKGIAVWIGDNSSASFDEAFFAGFVRRFYPAEANAADPVAPAAMGRPTEALAGLYRPNSSSMSGGGAFFDLLPPAHDIRVTRLDAQTIALNGVAHRSIGGDLYRRTPGQNPEADRVDSDRHKYVRFLTDREGRGLMQYGTGSATRIPEWRGAKTNLFFAKALAALLLLVGLGCAILRRPFGAAAALVGCGSLVLLSRLPAVGVEILIAYPPTFLAGRISLWATGALALATLANLVLRPRPRPTAGITETVAALAALALVAWALIWEILP
jgi:CubicO group peptidase (beta-lactamase class C family)